MAADTSGLTRLLPDGTEVPSKLTAIEASIALSQAYNEAYQLDCGPSQVEMSPLEIISERSLFSHRADDFAKLDINKHFSLNLMEYLDLPRDLIAELNRLATGYNQTETSTSQNVLSKLQNIQHK